MHRPVRKARIEVVNKAKGAETVTIAAREAFPARLLTILCCFFVSARDSQVFIISALYNFPILRWTVHAK